MLGNLRGFSPAKLTRYYSNMDLPADKEQLIRQAEEKHMDERVVGILRRIPPGTYTRVKDSPGGAAQEKQQEQQQASQHQGKRSGGRITDAIKNFTRRH